MARRSTEAHGDSQEARDTCADAQATQPGARAQAREEDTRASPPGALGARPARDRARARDGRLARLGGRPRRLAPLGLARRVARCSCTARPARLAGARLADARPQRARRPAALPNRPCGRHRRPARRARWGSRRGARRRARWRARPHPRRRGIRDSRRRPRTRGRAARDRSLRRSAAPPLWPRRATGGDRGSPLAGQPRVGRLERRRAAARARREGQRAQAPGTAARRRRGVPGRRGAGSLLRRAPAASRLRARARGHDGRGHRARLRRAYAGDGLPASRPLPPEGEPAGTRRRDGRQRPHRTGSRPGARELRRRGDDRRHDRRPACRPLRAPARPWDEGLEGRGTEGRPLVRARDDRDPHPRADPRQAGGRGRGSEPRAADGHARRHLRRPARLCEPPLGLARQGHLGELRLDRPRAHAASADRRHHGLGQVGLHQHAPDLDPAAGDTGRRPDDPDRPQADRAQLLRVDPAPPDARRLQPEGGLGGAPQRRRRDGAPLRAPLSSARGTSRRRTGRSRRAARIRCHICSS